MGKTQIQYKKYYLTKLEIVICLLAMAFLSSIILYIKARLNIPFHVIFIIKAIVWLFWGCWIPIIFYLSKKLPVNKKNYYAGLFLQIPISIFIISIHLLFYAWIIKLSPTESFRSQEVSQLFEDFFFSQFEWYFMTYWALILGSYAVRFYQKYREGDLKTAHLETSLAKAQLKALKMQLHPHFLFNTLNTISSLVRQDEKSKSISMLSELGVLLRLVLNQNESQFVTLESEINFITKYISLEEKRFKNKILSNITISEIANNALIPNLLLQPLIENSIYHGLSKKLDAKVLEINISVEKSILLIEIYNDGFSLPNDFDLTKIKGIGITNTIERLSHLYQNEYSIDFLNSKNGVKVKLCIPYKPIRNHD